MTGELTVVGEVLPIGGVREKVLAAKNFGLEHVLLPKANEPEAKELKKDLVRGLKIHFVEHFDEVFELVFGKSTAGAPKRRASRRPADKKTAGKKAASKKAPKKKAPKKQAANKKAANKAVRRRRA